MVHNDEITQVVETLEETNPDLITALGNRVPNAKDLVQMEVAPGHRSTIHKLTNVIYHVMSQDPDHYGHFHRVNVEEKSCTCPDAAAGRPCKHRLAVYIYKQLTDDPRDFYKNALIMSKSMSQTKQFRTWQKQHPTSRMDYHQWKDHPLYGTVTFVHPINGAQTVKVMARHLPDGITEVVAIQGAPFAKIHSDNHHTFKTEVFHRDSSQEPIQEDE